MVIKIMADVHSKETRSFIMSKIRSKDTKPELIVRKFLHAQGFRYKLHVKDLPGKPDIVLPKYKTVIFIHGCFWHGHDTCNSYLKPKSNIEFWNNKFDKNKLRDLKNTSDIHNLKWRVIVVWECELKTKVREKNLLELISKILSTDT